ncbi:pilin [Spongiibacter nanhainus]|uniref:Pilin n=1 Tax=Spongiibacter nanhainus TaxID=2794344 RepID=A0A7T4UQV7_9GAMM|nr:pilin [Spongiibacter nanhainus]QQD19086.1 pilin [Spongiibacter nanhainus]
MKKTQQGFTLIELMIVVAIIGILAAVALPAYQDYTTRSKISEGLTLASAAKTAVSEHAMTRNTYPADNDAAGYVAPDTQYVDDIQIANTGVVTITYKTAAGVAAGEDELELSPTTNASGVQWVCKQPAANAVLAKYLPSNCRS